MTSHKIGYFYPTPCHAFNYIGFFLQKRLWRHIWTRPKCDKGFVPDSPYHEILCENWKRNEKPLKQLR